MNINDLEVLEKAYEAALNAVDKIEYHETYPYYPEEIKAFMNLLVQEPWGDNQYQPSQVSKIMQSIDSADLGQIRWVLTAANRAERFCDGSWKSTLETRRLDPVFKRLREILDTK